jgi:hypothetical protein
MSHKEMLSILNTSTLKNRFFKQETVCVSGRHLMSTISKTLGKKKIKIKSEKLTSLSTCSIF